MFRKLNTTTTISFSERLIILAPWICILLIGILAIIFFGTRVGAGKFLIQVNNQKLAISLDLDQLRDRYSNYLRSTKDAIENIELDEKKLTAFFVSNKTLLLDQANITTISVTDKNFNVIYSNKFLYPLEYSNGSLLDKDYQQQIQTSAGEIIIANSVAGILIRKPIIDLAISLQDKNTGNFIGALIVSIPLTHLSQLSQTFSKYYLQHIDLVDNKLRKEGISTYEELYNHPVQFFLTKILFNLDKTYIVALDNVFKDSTVLLTYDLSLIRKNFFYRYFIVYFILLIAILLITWILFNYYILRPLLPIISSQNNLVIPGSKNIFAKIQEINTIYHLLQEKSLEYKQYNEKFIAVIGCFSFIASQINNKAEILTEDIEDIVLANPLYDQFQDWYKDTLRNIYQVSLNNREEMTEIMKVMTLTIQEVSHNSRESVDIIQILTSELNIEAELIIIDNNLKYETFSGMFFRKLLIQSLQRYSLC
ncbi:Putative histidine kinase receptor protein [Candidatus Trichorickettsia mobilis]|uniref:Histidine kinase receptor protein n=1 Tax=Candidatus Trichorickettsia mobilis TaxID=1346319 RepID=A0ABZ0UTY7_9RICK|nr:hypothetical protein [Candidatus Trichorickettsia mobilis]WPY00339.1 Putative histidine kinase receptor protein [Candidatus Trichorickettsia mobilis]